MPSPLSPECDAALLPFTKSNEELPEGLVRLSRQNLQEIETGLLDIHTRIELLRRQVVALQVDQQAYQQLLSPSRRLPNETIIQILQSCFEDPTMLDAEDRQIFATLRCVCQRWRSISFSSHELWQGLSITDKSEGSTPDIAQKMILWFDRAGPCTQLTLNVNWQSDRTLPTGVTDLLLDPRRRWRDLTLQLKPSIIYHLIKNLESGSNAWREVQRLKVMYSVLSRNRQPLAERVVPLSFFSRLLNTQDSQLPALKSLQLEQVALKSTVTDGTPSHAALSTLCLSLSVVSFRMMKLLVDPKNLPR
ncbi:hypothetical protein BKA70DRAFT_1406463, partial [Coprinopsis sp. MPI-PUGE-AT-0042]